MIIPEIEYTLKDGRKALIRSPRDEDIPGMLVLFFFQFSFLSLSLQQLMFPLSTEL